MSKLTTSFFLFLLAGFCFTLGNTFSKQTTVSVWALTSLRFLTVSLLIFFIVHKEIKTLFLKKNLRLHLLSLSFLLRCALIITGFQLSALAKPLAIILTWPIIFTLLSVKFLGTKINQAAYFALALATLGMVFILGDPSLLAPGENILGYGFMLAGSLVTAIEMLLNRRAIEAQGGIKVLFYSTFLAGVLTAPTLSSFFTQTNPQSTTFGLLVVALYVVGSVVLYLGFEKSTPITTAVFSYLEVPITAGAALYFFNEEFSTRSIFGIVLVLTGALIVSLDQAKRSKLLG